MTMMVNQMTAQLIAVNGSEICAGLQPENQAHICVSENLPIPLPPNSTIAYTWTVIHPNGTWRWVSTASERTVPIPWPGDYSVRVQMEYIRQGRRRPFAAFWTSPLIIHGSDCEG
ncbi:MAG: hypothetical protein DHS20C18_08980 [Saprospiraceae bacterium]|nr:MAG: hypothetical protein DHS20C18_08980 [Saprospiraceae bacterium]